MIKSTAIVCGSWKRGEALTAKELVLTYFTQSGMAVLEIPLSCLKIRVYVSGHRRIEEPVKGVLRVYCHSLEGYWQGRSEVGLRTQITHHEFFLQPTIEPANPLASIGRPTAEPAAPA